MNEASKFSSDPDYRGMAARPEDKVAGSIGMGQEPVLVVFERQADFDLAMPELLRQGFRSAEISVVKNHDGNLLEDTLKYATRTLEGAVLGVLLGVITGAVLGAFAGFAPDIFADDPLAAAVSGAVVCGMLGGCLGGIIGLGIPQYRFDKYETNLSGDSVLVRIKAPGADRGKLAKSILESFGGISVMAATKKAA
jgi:hypothetical protein